MENTESLLPATISTMRNIMHQIIKESMDNEIGAKKLYEIMNEKEQENEHSLYVLSELENQMKIHYAMPVRSMLYYALRYTKQCKKLEQNHRKEGDLKETDKFLSGMSKTDKLLPVINLVPPGINTP